MVNASFLELLYLVVVAAEFAFGCWIGYRLIIRSSHRTSDWDYSPGSIGRSFDI